MMSENPTGEWLSIADLAKALGVAKSTVSRRVSQLEAARLIDIRREGGRKLVQRASYEAACLVAVDGIKSLNGGGKQAGAASTGLAEQQARRTALAADILEMRVAELRKNLLPANEVAEAMARCGGATVRIIDRLPQRADELAKIATTDGVQGLRGALKAFGRELRETLASEMRSIAAEGQQNAGADPAPEFPAATQ